MYKLSLNRVHDSVRISEGNDGILLHVDGDPMRMVAGLAKAQKTLQEINSDTPEEEISAAALHFASVIFGNRQAENLMAFYHNDAGCVISVCGRYFEERLSKLIAKAQKKTK